MLVGPKPDHYYRRTDTKELIPPDGSFEASELDHDIDRALRCGDLVPVKPAARKAAKPSEG
jgi:hypothetical protein